MKSNSLISSLKAVLIPGLVFQTLITGGGFATGREVVQYFVRHNFAVWNVLIVVFISFFILFFLMSETSRIFGAFDYRTWGQNIIPNSWIGLDILFLIMAILVCAIVISGAVEVIKSIVLIPAVVGLIFAVVIVGIVTAGGKKFVLSTKIIGAAFLTFGYLTFAIYSSLWSKTDLNSSIAGSGNTEGWFLSSLEYIGYNTVALPACLYSFSYIKSRKQSMWASINAAVLLIVPLIFVALCIINSSPESLDSPIPLHLGVSKMESPILLGLYYCILIWTLLDTAVGMVYAILSRIETHIYERTNKHLNVWHRTIFALLFLISAILLSKVGIIDLIAVGYSFISYGFILFLVLPLLTIGVKRIYMQS